MITAYLARVDSSGTATIAVTELDNALMAPMDWFRAQLPGLTPGNYMVATPDEKALLGDFYTVNSDGTMSQGFSFGSGTASVDVTRWPPRR